MKENEKSTGNQMQTVQEKPKKSFFTTGEIGRMLQVSAVTVTHWIDEGILPGYRMPGSRGARRVDRQPLIDFIKAQPGLPMPPELKDETN